MSGSFSTNLSESTWLPPALTHMAQNVDTLFYAMLIIVTVFFVIVEVLLVVFLVRYRRTKRNRVGVHVHGNTALETIWTAIPALILVVAGAFSVNLVYKAQTPPAKPLTIQVIGHMWYWEFKYPNGLDVQNDLRIPAGQPVLFDITSGDVIHGFYIPAVRIQQDALPGRRTDFWVQAKTADIGQQFPVPCDQFCGQGHPKMVATLTVMSPSDFRSWTAAQLKKSGA